MADREHSPWPLRVAEMDFQGQVLVDRQQEGKRRATARKAVRRWL